MINFLLCLFSVAAFAGEPTLEIRVGKDVQKFTRTALLKHPDLQTITVYDPAFKQEMKYQAVPAAKLFAKFPAAMAADDSTLQFACTDGFSSSLDKAHVLNLSPDKSIAYVAIETTKNKWPRLPKPPYTLGPFYLVWLNAEKSGIAQEQWPGLLKSLEIKPSLRSQFPLIFPGDRASSSVQNGFEVFHKNCFACHTMNNQGTGHVGPDLNLPMGPTDYFKEDAFKKFVRAPSNLRSWNTMRMPAFNKTEISDDDIDNLVQYFRAMSKARAD